MSVLDHDKDEFVQNAKKVYAQSLKHKLEPEHIGKIIGLEPESGDYELGDSLKEVGEKCYERFAPRLVYYFRVGGGGAVSFGVAQSASA